MTLSLYLYKSGRLYIAPLSLLLLLATITTTYLSSPLGIENMTITLTAVALPCGLYAFMVIYYHLLAPRFQTDKQRAYLLSALSSGILTTISLPFVWTYATQGLGGMYEAGQTGWMGVMGYFGVNYFGVYLFGEFPTSAVLQVS